MSTVQLTLCLAATHPPPRQTNLGEAALVVLVATFAGAVLLILVADLIVYLRDRRWWRQHEAESDRSPDQPHDLP